LREWGAEMKYGNCVAHGASGYCDECTEYRRGLYADEWEYAEDLGFDAGYIYLIGAQAAGNIKIGRTKDHPSKRVSALSTGSPVELHLVGFFGVESTSLMESYLHVRYERKRMRGEWFDLSKYEVASILEIGDLGLSALREFAAHIRFLGVPGMEAWRRMESIARSNFRSADVCIFCRFRQLHHPLLALLLCLRHLRNHRWRYPKGR